MKRIFSTLLILSFTAAAFADGLECQVISNKDKLNSTPQITKNQLMGKYTVDSQNVLLYQNLLSEPKKVIPVKSKTQHGAFAEARRSGFEAVTKPIGADKWTLLITQENGIPGILTVKSEYMDFTLDGPLCEQLISNGNYEDFLDFIVTPQD
ncbi:MAG: hypothetical protein ACXVB4_08165 [Pseudobdellovibrionaceae bacterium]